MKTRTKLKFCKSLKSVALLMSGAVVLLAASEAPRRIKSNIVDAETVEVQGHIRPATAIAQDLGPVDGSQVLSHMAIHFAPTTAQRADLTQFLSQLQDPNSKNYHKFLTPEEYGARFGLNSADLAKVQLWLEQKGFGNIEIARGKNYISFSGNAAQAEAAFAAPLHRYQLNGQTLFANTTNPRIPKTLNGIVESIRGLQSPQEHPHIRFRPHYNSGSGAHFLTPDDWATIYDVQALYKAGYDGTGVKIVVVGQSDIDPKDIAAFRTAAGLSSTNTPTIIHSGTAPGIINGDQGESDLDLEWAGGIAKNATLVFVVGNPNSGNGVNDAITYAINNNLGQVLTTSYGACETSLSASQLTTQNSQFAQANAQGMTVIATAGDSGAADCDTNYPAKAGLAVDFPASSPYVLGVGGTTLTDSSNNWNGSNNSGGGSAAGYIPEKAWNNTSASVGLSATGGGMSVKFTKPTWQTGTGVPADGQRDVPDLAAVADPSHTGLLICSSDPTTVAKACSSGFADSSANLNVTGGTSAAAPPIAGVVALLVQKTGGSQGNINNRLYALAASTPTAFHDVTPGNNIVPCQSGSTGCPGSLQYGYSAGTGYDQTTGLGTLDANNLFGAWSDYGLSFNPTTLTVTHGTSGTSTLTVTALNGYSGTVTFTCAVASTLVAVTCTAPTSVTVNSTTTSQTTTLTINAGSTAHTPPWRFVPPVGLWRMPILAAALLSLCMSLLLLKQRRVNLFAAAVACFLLLGLASCGGSSSSSTSATNETGNVTVTASSGAFAKQISITVNIN